MLSRISLALAVAVAGIAGLNANTASANDSCGSGYGYGGGYGGHVSYDYDYDWEYDDCHYPIYKTIIVYKYKSVPYRKKLIRYDHCGEPYVVWKTYWRTVKIPVYKKIRIN